MNNFLNQVYVNRILNNSDLRQKYTLNYPQKNYIYQKPNLFLSPLKSKAKKQSLYIDYLSETNNLQKILDKKLQLFDNSEPLIKNKIINSLNQQCIPMYCLTEKYQKLCVLIFKLFQKIFRGRLDFEQQIAKKINCLMILEGKITSFLYIFFSNIKKVPNTKCCKSGIMQILKNNKLELSCQKCKQTICIILNFGITKKQSKFQENSNNFSKKRKKSNGSNYKKLTDLNKKDLQLQQIHNQRISRFIQCGRHRHSSIMASFKHHNENLKLKNSNETNNKDLKTREYYNNGVQGRRKLRKRKFLLQKQIQNSELSMKNLKSQFIQSRDEQRQ